MSYAKGYTVSAFRADDIVLDLGPTLPGDMRWRERRYIMWPAYMYRVVAPAARKRKVNILEKAVIGLCRAGASDLDRIASRLAISRDLAAEIVQALQGRELLDSRGLPTEQGQSLYEEEAFGPTDLVTGYVFQDPWAGSLWPRLVEQLTVAEVELGSRDYPALVQGSTGSRRPVPAFWYLPSINEIPAVPGQEDVLRASRQHRRALRNTELLGEDEEPDTRSEKRDVQIDMVSVVDDQPTQVLLASFVFLAEGDMATSEWMACDPFGLGLSQAWRRAIERQMEAWPPLRAELGRLTAQALDAQAAGIQHWTDDLRKQAELDLDERYTVAVRDLPHYEQLQGLQVGYREAEHGGERYPPHRLQDLMTMARRALEATFKAIAAEHPCDQAYRRLYSGDRPVRDRAFRESVFEGSASEIGFKTPLPSHFKTANPLHVKSAGSGDGWRLRPAIMAALLAARDDVSHPLRRAAEVWPDLFDDLDNLVSTLHGAAHDSGDVITVDRASAAIESVFHVVATLFDLSQKEAPGVRTMS